MSSLPETLRQCGVHTALFPSEEAPPRAEMACVIHTARCSYGLDEDGFCRELIIHGDESASVDRCLGAQYVASLDRRADEGLVADPRVGAHALFVARGGSERVALIKAGLITGVDHPGDRPSRPGNWHDIDVDLPWTLDAQGEPIVGIPIVPIPRHPEVLLD
jgi:hypothetical protein